MSVFGEIWLAQIESRDVNINVDFLTLEKQIQWQEHIIWCAKVNIKNKKAFFVAYVRKNYSETLKFIFLTQSDKNALLSRNIVFEYKLSRCTSNILFVFFDIFLMLLKCILHNRSIYTYEPKQSLPYIADIYLVSQPDIKLKILNAFRVCYWLKKEKCRETSRIA